ncbi:MAG: polysaccharide biosynthesis tyrosine autokinase [Pseudomonadota bacterium]
MNAIDPPDLLLGPPRRDGVGDSDTIDLAGLFGVIWRRKLLICGGTLAAIVLALLILRAITPTYTAGASVLLDTRRQNVTNITEVVSDLPVSASVVAGELAIIRSNLLIGEVVDKLDLVNYPEFDPRQKSTGGLLGSVRGWFAGKNSADTGVVAGGAVETSGPKAGEESPVSRGTPANAMTANEIRNAVIIEVQRRLAVDQGGISFVITIAFQSESPEMAATVANTVAEQYIEDQIRTKRDATKRATEWLSGRIEGLKAQVERAEDAVVQFKAEQSLEGGGVETTTQQLAELNSELIRARSARVVAEARHAAVQSLMEEGGLAAAATAVNSPLIETLSQQKAELERKEAELSKWFGPAHPDIVAVNAELEDISRSIDAEVQRAIASIQSDAGVEKAREMQLAQSIDEVEDRLVSLSETSVRLRQLERFADATRSVYENFLARYKETTEQAEFQRADARMISAAEPPAAPSHPRKKLILAASGVLGISLALALVFVVELLSKAVRTPEALAKRTGKPVLATLPKVPGRSGRRWLIRQLTARPATPFAEAARALRASLALPNVAESQIVLVTSATSEEGKSTTAAALGFVHHAIGRATVVVECDMRRPSMSDIFPTSKGFHRRKQIDIGEYLEDRARLDEIITTDQTTGLDIVFARKGGVSNSGDLLASRHFDRLLKELSERYEVIILDTAPTLLVSDAVVIASRADYTVLAVRHNRTDEDAVCDAIDRLESAGTRVAGTVLTRAASSALRGYYKGAYSYG